MPLIDTVEETYGRLVESIIGAAEKSIPKTSIETKRRPPVAWWNEDCEREEKIVRAEYRKHRRDPTNINKLRSFQRRRAIKQRTFRKARKDTWNKFVNSLNSRTK